MPPITTHTPIPQQNIDFTAKIPGLLEMQPISGIALKNIPDPYADPKSWPLDQKGKDNLTAAIESDYQTWAGRKFVDETLAAITAKVGEIGKNGTATADDLKELSKLHETLATQARLFESKGRSLVGVSDVQIVDGVLQGNSYPVPAVRYQKHAKVGAKPEVLAFSCVIGTSAVLVAEDKNGRKWMQVQARNEVKNFPHGGNLGCSPAGLLRHNPSIPGNTPLSRLHSHLEGATYEFKDLDNAAVKTNLAGEAYEEIGLLGSQLVKHRIIGLGNDFTHLEALSVLESSLSRDKMTELGKNRIEQVARESSKHPHDFAETFAWIPAEPEAIKEFLKLAISGPATHIANFLAYATDLVKDESGEVAAKAWLTATNRELEQAWNESKSTIRDFYLDDPKSFFLNMHSREVPAFDKFKSSKEAESTDSLKALIRDEGAVQGILKLALDKTTDETISRELVLAALAMQDNAIHTPSIDRFDPRRLPDKQGLKDPVTILRDLEAIGMDIDWGTIPVRAKQ